MRFNNEEALRRLKESQDEDEKKALRDRLVLENIPVAVRISRRNNHGIIPTQDERQQAVIGLLVAIDRYDPKLGKTFLQYAGWIVKGEAQRQFEHERCDGMTIPHGVLTTALQKIQAGSKKIDQAASAEGAAARALIAARNVSLDRIDPDTGRSLHEAMANSEPNPEEIAIHNERVRELHRLTKIVEAKIDNLEEKRGNVVSRRYAFRGHTPQSPPNVARELGISRQYVQRLEQEALADLSHHTGKSLREINLACAAQAARASL